MDFLAFLCNAMVCFVDVLSCFKAIGCFFNATVCVVIVLACLFAAMVLVWLSAKLRDY